MGQHMSHLNDIIKSSSYRIVANLASAIISISFMAYFARVFTLKEMAVYATLTILSAWNDTLSGLGLGTLVIKEAAPLMSDGQTDQAKRLISSVLVYRTISLFVLCLAWVALGTIIRLETFDSAELAGLTSIVIWISFISSCQGNVSSIQISVQKFMSREVINVVTVLCQRTLCVFGFTLSGITGFYWGYLLAALFGLGLGLVDIRNFLTCRFIPFPRIFRDSRSYFGLELLRSSLDHLDRPVIAFFLGAEALAGYHVAKRLYENFHALIIAIVVPAGVKIGELRSVGMDVLKEFYRNCMTFITHLFIPLGFFLAVISPQLLLLYGGEKYLPNTPVLIAFGFTLIGAALWTILRETALRLLSAKHLACQYLISAVVTLGGYLALLPIAGAWGIPVAMGLGYFAGLMPLLIPLKKEWGLQIPVRNFFTATGAGVSVSLTAIPLFLIDNVISQLVVAITLAGGIYITWLTWIGPVEAGNFLRNIGLRIRSVSFTS